MKSVFRLLPFLFLLGLSAYLPGVRAETCRANIGQTTVNIPNIKYLPTLPVNTQMTSAMADNGSGIPFSCDLQLPTASAKRIVYKQLKTGGESVVVCDSATLPALMTQQQTTVRIAVTFYKTGTVQLADGTHTNSPPLPQVGEMTIEQQTSASASFVASAPVSIDIAALNVDIGSSGSCQVATSTIQVSLGTVNRGEFHGKGTTGGQAKRFSIPVFCPTPTDVRIGFFGVSVESDTLALSQASNSASGVGVKLTYGNNPGAAVPDGTSVKINEASNLPILKRVTGASAGTAEAINFNAQYVQTDATVGAGTANSMVTFALEYN
ncbi:TPA: fimbrial protein [Klebsiella pneumoniae]|nr:fimbrial protein [Klebsiella pneumoniae]HBZ8768706.1 fimbrial protein [Klebsiella pneumoniae]HBZ8806921.1 fimbrial protein [Klebsiella pneumoniae]HBZ8809784.1 fimbrial protein [Klebsiella pneumoniae]HBZ8823464.1 fimbrial protein [Klebsiella pneumoniae]